jgi:uncharacterized protein (DUF952 family)
LASRYGRTILFHLAIAQEWDQARSSGEAYRQSTLGVHLEEQGFIHCSFADQVQGVADAVYHGRRDTVLLEIDPSLVGAQVRIENLEGGDDAFPHVYGPLPVAAVVAARDVPVDADGRLRITSVLAER